MRLGDASVVLLVPTFEVERALVAAHRTGPFFFLRKTFAQRKMSLCLQRVDVNGFCQIATRRLIRNTVEQPAHRAIARHGIVGFPQLRNLLYLISDLFDHLRVLLHPRHDLLNLLRQTGHIGNGNLRPSRWRERQ